MDSGEGREATSVRGGESRAGDNESPGRPSLVDGAEEAVRDWLAPGRFREGDRLPTEQQLAAMLGISRGTLRSALRRLEVSGEIVRRQGSGTFVGRLPASPALTVPWLRADSYTARARDGALSVHTMTVEPAAVGTRPAEFLGVGSERRTLQIRRVLAVAGVPVVISYDTPHPDLRLPEVTAVREHLGHGGTVHAMLVATTGVAFSLKRTQIRSVLVDPSDPAGRMLELAVPTACITLEDVSIGDGRPVLYARDIVAPGTVDIEVVQSAGATRPAPVAEREG